jgi:DNA-binding transcriptional LysR family regulator
MTHPTAPRVVAVEKVTSQREAPAQPFRVGFVPGVMPDKWGRMWRDRMRRRLELTPVEVPDQETALREGRLEMCLVRGDVDRDVLHLIPLYREVPVVVVPVEHPVTAYDEIDVAELAHEHDVLAENPGLSLAHAVETVAAGTGIAVMPMSLARLHHRKDVTHVPVRGVPATTVGLAWRQDADDDRIETFVGVVRGRTANSSRSERTGQRPGPRRSARRR